MASKQQRTQKRTAGGQDVGCTEQQHTQDQGDTSGAKRRTQMDVGEELIDPEGKQSQGIMTDRTKVQTIIRRVHPKLRSQLNLNEEFLIELKATDPEVISDEEHVEIRTKTGAKRIDHLLELIKLKTTGAYFSFMEVLERKDGDLYKIVKNVQDTICTGRPPRQSNHVASTAPPPPIPVSANPSAPEISVMPITATPQQTQTTAASPQETKTTAVPPQQIPTTAEPSQTPTTAVPPQQTPTSAVPPQQAPSYSADMFNTQQAAGPVPVTSALRQAQIFPTPALQPLYPPWQQFSSQQMIPHMSPANINMQPYFQPFQQPPPPQVAPTTWTPSATGMLQGNSQSNFNLKECQDELKKFYLDEMGKVQLLPWGQEPDDIADMEAIFVDLELVKKETALSLKESTKLDSNEELVALTNRGQRFNRVLVQGEGGSGKSTLLANIAYKWALQNPQSPLSQYQLVFILGMHEIQDKIASLIDLIFQQILKVDSKVSKKGLRDYIISHAKDVLLLFDGLDEDSSSILSNQSGEVTQVLHNRKLYDSCVILTSRPHKVDDLGDFQKKYVHVNLTGFSMKNIVHYITKIIQNKVNIERLLEKLRQEPHLMAMAATPVLLLMICLLWKAQCTLPDTKTQLYQETMNYLWRRHQKKIGLTIMFESQGKNMDPELATLLNKLGKVALNGIAPLQETEERVMFTERDIGEVTFILGCKVGIISRERLRSKLNVVSSVTFLHKTFQEFCAAMYLADLYGIDRPGFYRYLQKLQYLDKKHTLHTKPGVLEFCCGTKPEIAPVVLKYNASLICQCLKYHYLQLPHIHTSLTLRCVFESQLTHKECLNYLQIYSNLSNMSLSISHEDIAPILYQLKLISSQSVSNNHLLFPLLINLKITIGFTPWLHRLLKYTPNLVTLWIDLRTANIDTSDIIPLYEALTDLHHLRHLIMIHCALINSPDITSMLRMMFSHTKENMFKSFFINGFQFDCRMMAEFLNSNQSLIQLHLQPPYNLNEQATITEILRVLPNLKKLKCLRLEGYRISSDIKNLKPIISQLEELYLAFNQLDEKHMIDLFSFLNSGHILRTLDLSGNPITVASMTSLVQCLPGGLENLCLEQTDLNDETACILASHLKVRSTIPTIGLYGNPDIGTIGKDALQGLPIQILWDIKWTDKVIALSDG